jgi:hypothetical protein
MSILYKLVLYFFLYAYTHRQVCNMVMDATVIVLLISNIQGLTARTHNSATPSGIKREWYVCVYLQLQVYRQVCM